MAATTSVQQHFVLQQTPLRTLNRGNHFLRSSRNAVSVKRKSAVELLQETKSLYVKSETVLDRKQELKTSSCYYTSVSQQRPGGGRCKENKGAGGESGIETRDAQPPMPPPKSPRLINIPQRRSTTPAPTCSDQLQTKLRKLLNADSKENLLDDAVQETVQTPIRSLSRCSSHTTESRSSTQKHCPVHHKSLPDLHTTMSSLSSSSSDNSEHSDPLSFGYATYNTSSSEHYAIKNKSGDAMSLASSNSRRLTFSTSTEDSESSSSSSDDQNVFAYSSSLMVVGSPVKSCASYNGSTTVATDHRDKDSDWNTSIKNTEQYHWRPILRSKSDVGRRYTRLSTPVEPPSPSTPPDLETFFEQLGLDSADYSVLIKDEDRSHSSSPVFFSDTSTVDSANLCITAGGQSADTENPSTSDLPSIVERNARIIKWLCNCRKAQVQNSQPTRHTTLS